MEVLLNSIVSKTNIVVIFIVQYQLNFLAILFVVMLHFLSLLDFSVVKAFKQVFFGCFEIQGVDYEWVVDALLVASLMVTFCDVFETEAWFEIVASLVVEDTLLTETSKRFLSLAKRF